MIQTLVPSSAHTHSSLSRSCSWDQNDTYVEGDSKQNKQHTCNLQQASCFDIVRCRLTGRSLPGAKVYLGREESTIDSLL